MGPLATVKECQEADLLLPSVSTAGGAESNQQSENLSDIDRQQWHVVGRAPLEELEHLCRPDERVQCFTRSVVRYTLPFR